jgi:hypothetical protein
MKRLVILLYSFVTLAHEMQPLLGQSLTYVPKSYETILQSQNHFVYLQKQTPTASGAFLENMLSDIRKDKAKLYQEEWGTPCKKCQTGSIVSIAASSPLSLYVGWLTHNFCITLSGGIGTFIYLPAVGFYFFKIVNERKRLEFYEHAAKEWQQHLIHGDYGIKPKIME